MTGGAQESEMQLEMSRKEGALPLGLLGDDLRNGGLFWTKCVKHVLELWKMTIYSGFTH